VLRGAIIGFGAVAANGHWPGYEQSREAKIVAVVERAEERRRFAQELIPSVAAFATMEALVAGPGIDFVDICTPPALHGAPMREALAQGWNVLCEKPLLLDLEEVEEIRSLARESQRAVVPVHNWKYAPIISRTTEALRSGAIGKLRAVEIETLRSEDCAAVDPDHPNWRREPALSGGGILMDHGWHAIYLARHWFGEAPTNLETELHRAANGIEDEAKLTLHFPRGDAQIFLTWRADRRRNRMRLRGDRGEIAIDDDTFRIRHEEIRFESALSAGSHHPDWFAAMLPEVIAQFRAPGKAQASFDEAALCLSTIRRAYQTARIV
jgi:predicted dehydrogenase